MTLRNRTFNPGYLEVIVGTMYSGKSKSLLLRGERASHYGKKEVYYFRPAVDTRDDKSVSRASLPKENCIFLDDGKDVLVHLHGKDDAVVLIDEVQFFDSSIVDAIQILKLRGFNIIVAGLDKDFRGQPFGVTALLMALCDTATEKLYPVCSHEDCIADGLYPQRIREGKPESAHSSTIVIEGDVLSVEYKPVCKEHHVVPDLESYLLKKINEDKETSSEDVGVDSETPTLKFNIEESDDVPSEDGLMAIDNDTTSSIDDEEVVVKNQSVKPRHRLKALF